MDRHPRTLQSANLELSDSQRGLLAGGRVLPTLGLLEAGLLPLRADLPQDRAVERGVRRLTLRGSTTASLISSLRASCWFSDMESWVHRSQTWAACRHGTTSMMTEWSEFVANQRKLTGREAARPKLVCIGLRAYQTVQAPERNDIGNIGGFFGSQKTLPRPRKPIDAPFSWPN